MHTMNRLISSSMWVMILICTFSNVEAARHKDSREMCTGQNRSHPNHTVLEREWCEGNPLELCRADRSKTNRKITGTELQIVKIKNGNTSCKGTWIAPHIILTAAHCFFPNASYDGENSTEPNCKQVKAKMIIQKSDGTENQRKIVRAYRHIGYAKNQGFHGVKKYDVAIAILGGRVGHSFKNGFETDERGESSTLPLKNKGKENLRLCENIPILKFGKEFNVSSCSNNTKPYIDRNIFCVTPAANEGDSGGPIICRTTNDNYYFAGIISQNEKGGTQKTVVQRVGHRNPILMSIEKQCDIN